MSENLSQMSLDLNEMLEKLSSNVALLQSNVRKRGNPVKEKIDSKRQSKFFNFMCIKIKMKHNEILGT